MERRLMQELAPAATDGSNISGTGPSSSSTTDTQARQLSWQGGGRQLFT